ncbi:hypothetical protein EPO34_01615 [Patescibacteria group bacterium]|nr:MAG: hypothetical protein EPO34_01615 [Patescibacteria group bacterium]
MKNLILIASMLAFAACEGRTIETPATTVNATCPALPEQNDDALLACLETISEMTTAAQDEESLVACLGDLEAALDLCEEAPAPVTVDVITCQANSAVVASATDCPRVNLVCAPGTTPFSSPDTGEFRCDEQHLTIDIGNGTPQGDLVLPGTGVADVAHFRVTNLGTAPAPLTGVKLENVAQQPLESVYVVDVIRNGVGTYGVCTGRIDLNDGNGCLRPLTAVTVGTNESVDVVVRVETPAAGTWPNNDRYVQMRLVSGERSAYGNWFLLANSRLTVSKASGSPSGGAVPGLIEVAQMNWAANARGDIFGQRMTFEVEATDNAGSGWIDGLMNPAKWQVFDRDDSSEMLDTNAGWSFQSTVDGLVIASLDFYQNGSLVVEQGNTRMFVVKTDTTGAGANDTFRLTLVDVQWTDGHVWSDGFYVNNLPVEFGRIDF